MTGASWLAKGSYGEKLVDWCLGPHKLGIEVSWDVRMVRKAMQCSWEKGVLRWASGPCTGEGRSC